MKKVLQKRLLAVATALCLLPALFACGSDSSGGQSGGTNGGNIEYGRYVEVDITPPDIKGHVSAMRAGEGSVDILTNYYEYDAATQTSTEEYYHYRSEDNGASWQTLDMSWTKPFIMEYVNDELAEQFDTLGYYMAIMEDGSIIATINTYDQYYNQLGMRLVKVLPDGQITDIDLPAITQALASGNNVDVSILKALPDNRYFLSLQIYNYSEEGYSTATDFTEGTVYNADTNEKIYDVQWDGWQVYFSKTALLLQNYDNTYTVLDINTGASLQTPIPSEELLTQAIQGSGYSDNSLVFDADNTAYSLNSRGVQKVTTESTELETIMRAENYTFGSPLAVSQGMALSQPEGSATPEFIIITGENSEIEAVSRYYYDPEAPASSDTVLKVYSMYDSITVRQTISELRKQHPEYEVEYTYSFLRDEWGSEVTPQDSEVLTTDDALRQLSNSLLSGTGPDILILDDLPLESYIEQGILADITEIVAQTDLISGVAQSMQKEGVLYAVPASIKIPVITGAVGTLDAVASLDTLLQAMEADIGTARFAQPNYETATQEEIEAYYEQQYNSIAPEDRPILGFTSVEEATDMLYTVSLPGLYTTKSGVNEDALRTLLEQVKLVTDVYSLPTLGYANSSFSQSGFGYGSFMYVYPMLLEKYGIQQTQYGYTNLVSMELLRQVQSNLAYSGIDYIETEDGNWEEVVNETMQVQPPQAQLLQGPSGGVYYPVSVAGICSTTSQMEAAQQFILCMLSDGVQSKDLGAGLPATQSAFINSADSLSKDAQYYTEQKNYYIMEMDMRAIAASLNSPAYANEKLQTLVQEYAAQYCTGEITLDAAVSGVLADSQLYFAELQ